MVLNTQNKACIATLQSFHDLHAIGGGCGGYVCLGTFERAYGLMVPRREYFYSERAYGLVQQGVFCGDCDIVANIILLGVGV